MFKLNSLFSGVVEAFTDTCLGCGECVSACPYLSAGALKDRDPATLSAERLDLLNKEGCTADAYHFLRGCLLCGACRSSCPLDLDPYLINIVSRNRLASLGGATSRRYRQDTANLTPILPDNPRNRFKLLHSLQVRPEEVAWETEVPASAPKVDAVLLLSCMVFSRADRIFTLMDILRKLDTDFSALGGVDFCCGFVEFISGDREASERSLNKIAAALEAFRAKTLIVDCATCYGWFRELSKRIRLPFEVIHIFEHIHANLDRLTPAASAPRRVATHRACHFGQNTREQQVLDEIVQALPGVELVSVEALDPAARCCGASASGFLPDLADRIRNDRLREAQNAQLDLLLTPCDGCYEFLNRGPKHAQLAIAPLEAFFAASLGVTHPNRLIELSAGKCAEVVLSRARGRLWETQFRVEEMRPIVAGLFNIPEK